MCFQSHFNILLIALLGLPFEMYIRKSLTTFFCYIHGPLCTAATEGVYENVKKSIEKRLELEEKKLNIRNIRK